jgi:hypothetical protein
VRRPALRQSQHLRGDCRRATQATRQREFPSLVRESRRPLAKFIDSLRCLRFRQGIVELLSRFATQRLQVGALRVCHRLVAGFPFIGLTLQRRLRSLIRGLVFHAATGTQDRGHSTRNAQARISTLTGRRTLPARKLSSTNARNMSCVWRSIVAADGRMRVKVGWRGAA